MKKGNSSLSDYFAKIKRIVDSLAAVGKSISYEDHILYILAGLGSEYESMISVITAKVNTDSVQDIMALLLTHETRLESKTVNADGSVPSANVVQQQPTYRPSSESKPQRYQNFNSGNGRGRGKNNGRGGSRSGGRNKFFCTICNKHGHTSSRCYYRNDAPSHHARPMFANQSIGPMFPSNFQQPPMSYQMAPSYGYQYSPQPHGYYGMQASSTFNSDNNWYPNSGATNHLTNNFGNLSMGSEFGGSSQVHVGNGAGSSNWSGSAPRDST